MKKKKTQFGATHFRTKKLRGRQMAQAYKKKNRVKTLGVQNPKTATATTTPKKKKQHKPYQNPEPLKVSITHTHTHSHLVSLPSSMVRERAFENFNILALQANSFPY